MNLKKKTKLTKKDKLLKENKRKKFKYVVHEYKKWKAYTGSSDQLNEDIKNGHNYSKEIIKFCFSKADMTLSETKAIICSDCLLDKNCYNGWVSAKIYKKHLLNKDD